MISNIIRKKTLIFKIVLGLLDGNVHTYKGKLVAKGFKQVYSIDYKEKFSLVILSKSIRTLLSITAYYDYEIWQMDVRIAFFNGYLHKDVYMTQHESFVALENDGKACQIQTSIYGLNRAPKVGIFFLMMPSKNSDSL